MQKEKDRTESTSKKVVASTIKSKKNMLARESLGKRTQNRGKVHSILQINVWIMLISK